MNEADEEYLCKMEKNIAQCFILFALSFLMKMSHFYMLCQ